MAPFLAASVLYAIAPEFTKVARWRIDNTISGIKTPTETTSVPPHLSAAFIGDYVEYSIDVAQITPMLLLPLVGVLVSWHLGLDPGIAWVVFAGMFIIVVIVTILFLKQDPIKYVSNKLFGRYPLLQAVGLIVNLVAAGLVGAFI
jgi:hypothetical protein